MSKLTQNQRIMKHLVKIGPITAMDAVMLYHIMRLASRIAELRAAGIPIRATSKTGKNSYGEPVHYTVYWLDEEAWLANVTDGPFAPSNYSKEGKHGTTEV